MCECYIIYVIDMRIFIDDRFELLGRDWFANLDWCNIRATWTRLVSVTTGDWWKSLGNNWYTNPIADRLALLVGSDYSADLSVISLSYQDVIGKIYLTYF